MTRPSLVSPKSVPVQLSDRQLTSKQAARKKNRCSNYQALLLPGGKWTPHDLRRTGATLMVALGVLPAVAERCLNHTEEDKMKRTYQRHSYTQEMTAAWYVLGAHLDRQIALAQEEELTVHE